MRKHLRRTRWWKWAAAVTACGILPQAATCSSTPSQLGEQLVISVVDQWIVNYVNHQLNVTSSFF